jgi:pimeloyl-ACP methyl ester carboxylesterase
MPNANLLVAGTGGITFIDNAGKDIGYPVKMQLGVASKGLLGRSAAELIDLLSMEHIPGQIAPAKTSLLPGMSLRPGHVLLVAYNQVPSDFNHFLYDWRADIRYSAQQLLDFLQQRQPPNGRWNLVGHSQGGLLIVLASKLLQNRDDFEKLVASVTLVGTPLAGTVNSARAILKGDQMGDAASPAFKQIIRSWPSIHQMLPAWPSVLDGQGTELPAGEQLIQPGGWAVEGPISDDMLLRAREAQAMLRDPLGWMEGDIDVAAVMGRNRQTSLRVLRSETSLDADSLTKELGDTLVPHDRTIQWVGGHLGQFVKTFKSPCNVHSRLLNDPGVLTVVKQMLRA